MTNERPKLSDYMEKWSRKYLAPSMQELSAREEYASDLSRWHEAEIERLQYELTVQKGVVDMAYIPHRHLVEQRDRADKQVESLRNDLRVLTDLYKIATGIDPPAEVRSAPEPSEEVVPHGVIYDRPGWLCSQCGGWNHLQDKLCTHTHPASALKSSPQAPDPLEGHSPSCNAVAWFGSAIGDQYRAYDPDLADRCNCALRTTVKP